MLRAGLGFHGSGLGFKGLGFRGLGVRGQGLGFKGLGSKADEVPLWATSKAHQYKTRNLWIHLVRTFGPFGC